MHVRFGASLKNCNTLALEARARALVSIASLDELQDAVAWSLAEGLPLVTLGQGSNVILAGDLDALVLLQRSRGIQRLVEDDQRVRLRVAAGEDWHGLVHWCLQQRYFGLENLALIPGTVGAAPVQNIGAYGVELAPRVEVVEALDIASGETLRLGRQECQFAYRHSIFKDELRDRVVITALEIQLDRQPQVVAEYPALASFLAEQGITDPTPDQVFEAVVAIRRSKLPDPAQIPNVGSFFKNPVISFEQAAYTRREFTHMPAYPQTDGRQKIPAAWLIEQCGWKGCRRGGVGVHPDHALVVVNYASDSGVDVLDLAADIRRSVADRFGILLELEPRVYGGTA